MERDEWKNLGFGDVGVVCQSNEVPEAKDKP
jgi:hypothetical protein